ncbi:hypothetical protein A3K79_04375 [Candidatus Bathyarchaeota archaeon RBG_13_46_16b]|nr:MAG: hypothetical protein A3K79_04375 [Candidatus Bathyarchaeota archaeon RBG_13_46_16b]
MTTPPRRETYSNLGQKKYAPVMKDMRIKASPVILLLDTRLRLFLGLFWYFSRLLKPGQPKSSWTDEHLIFAFIDHVLAECVLADASSGASRVLLGFDSAGMRKQYC